MKNLSVMEKLRFIIIIKNTVNVAVYIFRLNSIQFTRILQGDTLSLPVTLKLNPRVKGWWLIIQTFLWLFCFISGLTNYCWMWVHSGGEKWDTDADKSFQGHRKVSLPASDKLWTKHHALVINSPDYNDKVLQSFDDRNTPELLLNCIVQNSNILPWHNKHWFSLKCHNWQHSMMSILVRLTTRGHPILSQISSPLAQSASLVCHIELSRPKHHRINRKHHSGGAS